MPHILIALRLADTLFRRDIRDIPCAASNVLFNKSQGRARLFPTGT